MYHVATGRLQEQLQKLTGAGRIGETGCKWESIASVSHLPDMYDRTETRYSLVGKRITFAVRGNRECRSNSTGSAINEA